MKLFVGNLPWDAEEEEVSELFKPFGEVVSVKIIKDSQTGRSRGFCFVEMDSDEAGNGAIKGLDNTLVGGRPIRVSEARNENRSGSGQRGERRSFDNNRRGGNGGEFGQRRYQGFQNNSRGYGE
ncbi:MAG: hypothetical protein QRY74_05775 [Chlamydia sp.]